ncbi:hypothetical protein KFU94_44605 [Chloroflexi bacterium TSY]|nr:hypothetical protein [Chloroflexi bacterium TSY]
MSRLVEVVQAIARHEVKRHPYLELAVVTSNFDDADGADSHTVSVKLKNSGLAINRVPLASTVGGAAALPRQGDVVLVLMPRGDLIRFWRWFPSPYVGPHAAWRPLFGDCAGASLF